MLTSLKVLILEDSLNDALLIEHLLKKMNIDFSTRVVDSEKEFIDALETYSPDVILSDHNLPSFDSIKALETVKERQVEIPFILLSGDVSQEFAVSCIQKGAYDYIMKDRMERLPSAILNALEKYSLEKKTRKEIERNEKKFQALVENAGDLISMINEEGKVIYASPALKKILGYEVKEIIGNTFLVVMHPDHVAESKRTFDLLLKKPNVPFNRTSCFISKDGRHVWMEGTAINLLHDENINAIISNYRDITERKNSEEDRAKLTYDILQRNKELEQFTYIVSHNLRAPVANITGFAKELEIKSYNEEDRSIFLSELIAAVKRLDDIILDLNDILHSKLKINEKKEEIFLSQLVNVIKDSIANLITKENVEIKTDFIGVEIINTVRSYIHSIFYNLILNSIKYRQPDKDPVIKIISERKGEKIKLVFTDNGLGIDLSKKSAQVFGLYKRFHPGVEGKGLGLFMVKSQVVSLGGEIKIQSVLNEGTTFEIELPIL